MLQGDFVIDETAIDYKLHEFWESHGIGLRFGKSSPKLIEPSLIVLFEDDWIVAVFCHWLQALDVYLILKLILSYP